MKQSIMTRLLALLLAVVMVLGLGPVAAFAAETDGGETGTVEETSTQIPETEATEAAQETEPQSEVTVPATESLSPSGDAASTNEVVTQSEGFTVTFNANGGTGTMAAQTVATGKLTKNTFTRNGFSFIGWNTAANGSGTSYKDEAEVTLTANITLYAQWKDEYYSVVSEKNWEIAPGITETELILNNATGTQRQVLHIMEADMNNPYTKVTTSYTNMDTSNYAVSNMLVQANWVRDNWGWNVVGAMNCCLSWYNSAAYAEDPSRVNEPLGFMMIDSEIYFDHSVGFPTVLVIHKDTNDAGEPRPDSIPKVQMRTVNSTADLNGWEDQVIPTSSGFIVKEGINQYTPSHTGGAPRSVVGIKPDGTVVIMMNDGRQDPYSIGMNMYELADVMISLGCSYAVNCDGGGSSTFLSQRPGTTGLAVNCSPSDGALRENTSGILIISTAAADGEFDSAYISSEYDYYVPHSVVTLNADGLDFSGAAAEIPAEAVWTLSDASFGTVANGVFTSTGKTGEVAVQIEYEGEVVGSKTLTIVNPDSIGFAQAETVIPYGKTVALSIEAVYGVFEVGFTPESFTWVVSDEKAGVRDGMSYTATMDETVKGVVITATYKYADLGSTTLTITFGKGSEIKWDFEDGDVSNWMGQEQVRQWLAENGIAESGLFPGGNYSEDNSTRTFLSSVENGGQVKNGKYALGLEVDYRHSRFSEWSYTVLFNVEGQTVLRDVANGLNATKLGMWVYIPEGLVVGKDLKGLAMQYQLYGGTSAEDVAAFSGHLLTADGKNLASLTDADIPEDRWVYFYIDLTSKDYVSLQNPNAQIWREPSFIRFYTQHYTPKNLVFYFDDLTLDYSDAVDDRDAPVISNLTVDTEGNNRRTFNATIADFAATNTSGLDYSSAKIYVDGVALNGVAASGNRISGDAVEIPCGTHTVTFEISDNMGNTTKESMSFTVAGTAPVTLGGHNDLNNAPEYDSVYYVDINVAEIEKIEAITAVIDLNTAHLWEIEGLTAAEGFTATASVNQYANTVTVTVTKTGECPLTGAQTLVSIPSRIYSWRDTSVYTAEEIFATGLCPVVPFDSKIVSGSVTFVDGAYDGYVGVFGGSISVTTNLDDNKNPWHTHTVIALDDLAATCTTDGYTGRTYCEGCGSVIDWGTKASATGHSFDFVDGVLQCTCGKLFTGVHTDGKAYVDGVVVSDGWVNDTYYKDGVMLTGIQKVPAPDSTDEFYYDFGTDGVCKNKAKYTGIFQDGELYRYSYLGVLTSGWQMIDNEWYYFSSSTMAAVSGHVKVSGVYFDFEENGKLISGVWVNAFNGWRYFYGPSYHQKEWQEIDGEWYYFKNGYRLEGIQRVKKRGDVQDYRYYDFGEDGISQGMVTGIHEFDGKLYYLEEGRFTEKGLFKLGDNHYYAQYDGSLIVDQEYYAWKLDSTSQLSVGHYVFDADGRVMGADSNTSGIIEKDGVLYYYENGKPTEKGLFVLDGAYYYAQYDGSLIVNQKYYVWKLDTSSDLPVGTYEFGADGKMLQGIVDKDGVLYYYENGKPTEKGLFVLDGVYYYAQYDGSLIVNQKYYAWKLDTSSDLPVGTYEFGADGKMLHGIVDKNGVLYCYENGKAVDKGLFLYNGAHYFTRYDGELVVDCKYYAWKLDASALIPKGNYIFAADGKVIGASATGEIVNQEGVLYYYENGKPTEKGLFLFNGDYYVAQYDGKLIVNQKYYVWKLDSTAELPKGHYEFNADGKMLRGIVDKDGVLYYYENGKPTEKGLFLFNGDYYVAQYDGKLIVNQKYYVWKLDSTADLPKGHYEFGAEGKMLHGIVDKDGVLYYYENGKPTEKGLFLSNGDYYVAQYDGKLITNQKYYVWKVDSTADLPKGNYEFGTGGKMLQGIIDKAGVLYYYENGQPADKGLFILDGHYYYALYNGKLVVNQKYHVWKDNGLLHPEAYTFNEYGQIVG